MITVILLLWIMYGLTAWGYTWWYPLPFGKRLLLFILCLLLGPIGLIKITVNFDEK